MTKAVELFVDGAWSEFEAYEAEGWKYVIGPSGISGIQPNSLEVTLANDDLDMDPSNVASPYYGRIGRNTPARLVDYIPGATTVTDSFTRTVASGWGSATSGQTWTTSGGSASDFAVSSGLGRMTLGSINVSRRATLAAVVSGGDARMLWTIPVDPTGDDIETTLMVHYQDANNYVQASIYWDREGRPIELQFVRRVAGVVTQLAITHLTMSPVAAGLTCWMRVQWSGSHLRMKAWPAAATEPELWTLSAIDTTWPSGQVGIRANLQPLFAGGTPQLVTVDNFSLAAFTADVLCTGEASSWKPAASVEHVPGASRGRAQVDLTAEGILRRLGRWEESTRSPLARQIGSYASLLGYWRLEDPAQAQNLANDTVGGSPGTFTEGVKLSADDGAAGARAALTMELGSQISGRFQFDATSDGYQISWLMKLDELPTSGTYIAVFQWTDTMQRIWYWRINNASFEWEVNDEYGAQVAQHSAQWGAGLDPTEWVRYRMKVSVTGSTVTFEPAWYMQDFISVYGTSDSFTNVSVGYPIGWQVVANAYTAKAAYGHVFGVSDLSLDLLNDYDAKGAFNAYTGETAFARYVRLMRENGLSYRVYGTNAWSPLMGRQPRGTLLQILEDLRRTDGGLIYDAPDRVRLIFAMNNYLANQTPVLALTKGVDVGYPLVKVIDDQGAANDITVENWDGTEARVTKTTGELSVLPPPAGVGRYSSKLEVSLRWAEALEQRGAWELANNTLPGPRYPTVNVDLLANPSLKQAVAGVRPGSIITIDGELPDKLYLLVVQIERKGGSYRDTASFTCVPADLYVSGEYDDGVRRYDSASTTLAEDLTTTETDWDLFIADPADRWRPGSSGYDVIVGGERCTVTNVTTGAASGAGWTQTMTCTRSVNGVVKPHATGAEVHVFQPARYVLRSRTP